MKRAGVTQSTELHGAQFGSSENLHDLISPVTQHKQQIHYVVQYNTYIYSFMHQRDVFLS